MFTKDQEILLTKFANLNDRLFELGITTTDSFTGEIGEYVVCKYFKLKKTVRVTRAVDGVCELGKNYQVKAKVISNSNFNYKITKLDTTSFDFLAVVYFDQQYNPVKIIRIPSHKIIGEQISITSTLINSGVEIIDKSKIKIPVIEQKAINEFAKSYNQLKENGIIRSRHIVGDIGEFYACKHLELERCNSKNEKGLDARHKSGLTFEIKTRRVYESERRISETRRLNNLNGKSADFLIVVVIDKLFKCSGMWLIPMLNLTNPKSANLKVVNSTFGTRNLIPSKISWLETGEKFTSFKIPKKSIPKSIIRKSAIHKVVDIDNSKVDNSTPLMKQDDYIKYSGNLGCDGFLKGIILILAVLYFIWRLKS